MTPKQIIVWLENHQGCALVSDDNGHWSVSGNGFQNAVCGDEPQDVETTFFIEAVEWKNSIKEAVEHAAKNWEA